MKVLAMCGSMRFAQQMQEIAYALETERGFCVLTCVCPPEGTIVTDTARERLAEAHRERIARSDGIYVVNIGGYIGDAVREEIRCAQAMGKEVLYHCEA